jgi:uncharacterized membrane protein (UPF0127 family)
MNNLLGISLLLAVSPGQLQTNPDRIYQLSDLNKVVVKFGARSIPAFVCDTDAKRQEGMMFLTAKEIKNTEGFLFVFPDAQPRSFWMRNTVLPLDIIYLDSSGKVLNIMKGKPFVKAGLASRGPSQFVLELKQGMADKFGIKPGSRLTIPKIKSS